MIQNTHAQVAAVGWNSSTSHEMNILVLQYLRLGYCSLDSWVDFAKFVYF